MSELTITEKMLLIAYILKGILLHFKLFPFMIFLLFQFHFAVIFDTSKLSGENETLQFLVQAKR